jgi:hypothetical protein
MEKLYKMLNCTYHKISSSSLHLKKLLLMPQLKSFCGHVEKLVNVPHVTNEEELGYIFQQHKAPLHWHLDVRGTPIATCQDDELVCTWPLNLVECDFFLRDYASDSVYVSPFPAALLELRSRIITAIGNVTQDMLERVWRESNQCLDVCR